MTRTKVRSADFTAEILHFQYRMVYKSRIKGEVNFMPRAFGSLASPTGSTWPDALLLPCDLSAKPAFDRECAADLLGKQFKNHGLTEPAGV